MHSSCEEDCVARAFAKYGLRLDVTFASGHVGRDRNYPYIPVSSWIESLDRAGKLSELVGCRGDFGNHLKGFWTKFQQVHGDHQFFQAGILWERALPIYLHGD